MGRIVRAAALGLAALAAVAGQARAAGPGCEPGAWLDPATGGRLEHAAVVAAAASRAVVLLGETHDNAEHHRWQLSTLAALFGRRHDLVLGFEAFPRRVQPILDRWIAGGMAPEAFFEEVGWDEVWGYNPDLYLPLLHFARLHRIPVVALNVERYLVSRVGREGWDAVPESGREGLSRPAPATEAYLDRLLASYAQHQPGDGGPAAGGDPAGLDQGAMRDSPDFRRFVGAQLTWDRAMAEALAAARSRRGVDGEPPLVVGIVGSEHARGRHGVPRQLANLGVTDTAVLLPADVDACARPEPGVADALFLVTPQPPRPAPDAPQGPRLGVALGQEAGEVRVAEVVPDSIAAAAGVAAGDVVVQAAGAAVGSAQDLIGAVQRQAPGTWLPLVLKRDGRIVEAIAKFPPQEAAASR
jgi:uncharacterized iron-regulated protein